MITSFACVVTECIIDSLVDNLKIFSIFGLSIIEFIVPLDLLSAILVHKPGFKVVSVQLEEASLQAAHFLDVFFKLVVTVNVNRGLFVVRVDQVRMVANVILENVIIIVSSISGFTTS